MSCRLISVVAMSRKHKMLISSVLLSLSPEVCSGSSGENESLQLLLHSLLPHVWLGGVLVGHLLQPGHDLLFGGHLLRDDLGVGLGHLLVSRVVRQRSRAVLHVIQRDFFLQVLHFIGTL